MAQAKKTQLKDPRTGEKLYPVTSSACVGMSEGSGSLDTRIKNITTEYNVSLFHPKQGIDGGNKYTLETAIALVPEQYRNIGLKCSFVGENGESEAWEYLGTIWSVENFKRCDTYSLYKSEATVNNIQAGKYISTLEMQMLDTSWNSGTGKLKINDKGWLSLKKIQCDQLKKIEFLKTVKRVIFLDSDNQFIKSFTDIKSITIEDGVYFALVNISVNDQTESAVYDTDLLMTVYRKDETDISSLHNNIISKIKNDSLQVNSVIQDGGVHNIFTRGLLGSFQYAAGGTITFKEEGNWFSFGPICCINVQKIVLSLTVYRIIFYDKNFIIIDNKQNVKEALVPNGAVYTTFGFNNPENFNVDDYKNLTIQGVNELDLKQKFDSEDIRANLGQVCLNMSDYKIIPASWNSGTGELTNPDKGSNWLTIDSKIEITDKSKNIILKTPEKLLFRRVLFYGDDESYLGSDKTVQNTSVVLANQIPNNAKYFTFNILTDPITQNDALVYARNWFIVFQSEQQKVTQNYSTINYFSVNVNTKNPFKYNWGLVEDSATNDNAEIDKDYCLLMLPQGHTNTANPLKLVVFFHGSGEPVYENSSPITTFATANYFLYCGYAVLAVNCLPKKYANDNGLGYGRPVGNWMGIESANKAVEYVCNNFNLDMLQLYVYGESQGGMTAMNFVECGGFKINAVVLDSPAISMKYSQLNISGALPNMLHFYGFNNVESFSQEKVAGLDPYSRNCTEIIDADTLQKTGLYLLNSELNKIKSTRTIVSPTKFFLGSVDSVCPPFASQIVAKQIKNAGQFCECLLYNNIGHCVDQLCAKIKTINVNGSEYQVSQPMIDMAEWFCRFGGNVVE